MRVKILRGATMAEAMRQVRAELGPEALILSTQRSGGGFAITAGLEEAPPDTAPSRDQQSRDEPLRDAPLRNQPPQEVRHDDAPRSGGVSNPASWDTNRAIGHRAATPDPRLRQWRPPSLRAYATAMASEAASTVATSNDQAAAPALAWPDAPRPAAGPSARSERRAACLAWHGVPEAVRQRLARDDLRAALAAAFRFAPLPLEARSAPLLLAGPPGAGKTLTVARLATRCVLEGRTPLVITADGQRAGAAGQLAAFTRLLGLELLVACGPEALAHALGRRDRDQPVLVDSPGIDPFATDQLASLGALREAASARLVAILPAGLDPAEAGETAAALRGAQAETLVATRIDVSRRLGGVLAAAAEGLAFAEAGVGPGAADGLVPFTPDLLARRLLTHPDLRA